MLGSLIPCDGGPPISLSKSKLVLKLRSGSQISGGDGRTELLFRDGLWHIRATGDVPPIQINDVPCEGKSRLLPNDILTVGRHRYRLTYYYHAPHSTATSTPVSVASPLPSGPKPASVQVEPDAPPLPPSTPLAVDNPVLGMLIPCGGGRPIMLRKQQVIVGRSKECDVVVAVACISSRHCELNFIEGHWQVTDLDSRNGTFVDDQRFQTKWLFPGNVLGLSTQRFRLEYLPQGERPAVAQDDVPMISKRSLMACVGLTEDKLGSLESSEPDTTRRRWQIDVDDV